MIDNGSSDGTAALIQARPVTYLREAKRGVSNARNRGIAESRGEILSFVDADCLVEPQWLTELVRPFEDPAVGSVGGDLQHAPPTTAAERQAARMLGNWQRFAFTSNPAYPITANAAYRRDVLDRIGPFNPHMTRAQDVELGLRFRSTLARPPTPNRNRSPPSPLHPAGLRQRSAGLAGLVGEVRGRAAIRHASPIRVISSAPSRVRHRHLSVAAARRQWIEDAWFDFLPARLVDRRSHRTPPRRPDLATRPDADGKLNLVRAYPSCPPAAGRGSRGPCSSGRSAAGSARPPRCPRAGSSPRAPPAP